MAWSSPADGNSREPGPWPHLAPSSFIQRIPPGATPRNPRQRGWHAAPRGGLGGGGSYEDHRRAGSLAPSYALRQIAVVVWVAKRESEGGRGGATGFRSSSTSFRALRRTLGVFQKFRRAKRSGTVTNSAFLWRGGIHHGYSPFGRSRPLDSRNRGPCAIIRTEFGFQLHFGYTSLVRVKSEKSRGRG